MARDLQADARELGVLRVLEALVLRGIEVVGEAVAELGDHAGDGVVGERRLGDLAVVGVVDAVDRLLRRPRCRCRRRARRAPAPAASPSGARRPTSRAAARPPRGRAAGRSGERRRAGASPTGYEAGRGRAAARGAMIAAAMPAPGPSTTTSTRPTRTSPRTGSTTSSPLRPHWEPIAFGALIRQIGKVPWSLQPGPERERRLRECEQRTAALGLPLRWPRRLARRNYSILVLRAALVAAEHERLREFSRRRLPARPRRGRRPARPRHGPRVRARRRRRSGRRRAPASSAPSQGAPARRRPTRRRPRRHRRADRRASATSCSGATTASRTPRRR